MAKTIGHVAGVNGNLVTVTFEGAISKNEVAFVHVGDTLLKGEVIRVNGSKASMQVYEMTNGIQVGDEVEFTGELMSVELGPGLLTQIYDGLQNPLPSLASQCGFFLQRGVYLDPIPTRDWEFTPICIRPGPAPLLGSRPDFCAVRRISPLRPKNFSAPSREILCPRGRVWPCEPRLALHRLLFVHFCLCF